MKRAAIVMVLLALALAPDLSACKDWSCTSLEGGHKECGTRFDGGSGDSYAVDCDEVCDCGGGICGCWCEYETYCFQV